MHPFKHFVTITRHRHAVIRHAFKAGIGFQGLFHDLSKYALSEFVPGARYYTDGRRSPNETERISIGYSSAWLHHKGRNKHHFEYWNDLNMETKTYEPVKMPLRYVAEMFCDRLAASKIYQGKDYTDAHPLFYFQRGNTANKMHKDTAAHLEIWLTLLRDEGEDAVFKRIREELKAKKEY